LTRLDLEEPLFDIDLTSNLALIRLNTRRKSWPVARRSLLAPDMKIFLIISVLLFSQLLPAQNMNVHDWMMRMQQSLICLSYENLMGCKDDKTMLVQFKEASRESEKQVLQFPKYQEDSQKMAKAKAMFAALNETLDQLGHADKTARAPLLEKLQAIMSEGHRL
jgi:hypothetical protein